jgi:prolyl oligopeptidase
MRLLLLGLLAGCAGSTGGRPEYPPSFRGPDVDNYHGTFVEDPYRWLEKPDAPETRAWVDAQNALTFGFLEKIPARKPIRARLEELMRFERRATFRRAGDHLFYKRNEGLQNQYVLWVARPDGSSPRVLVDPNTLSSDGTVALGDYYPSHDGALLAYSVSTAGSDWEEWRVRDVETGKDLSDVIRWAKFSGAAWKRDGSGFFYQRYPEPRGGDATATDALENHHVYFHRLGTPQSADPLVYAPPDKAWFSGASVTDDGKWLLLYTFRDSNPVNLLSLKALDRPDAPIIPLVTEWKGAYEVVAGEGDHLWVMSNVGAPRGRILGMDPTGKETVLVPEGKDTLLKATAVRGHLLLTYSRDAASRLAVHKLDGTLADEVSLGLVSAAWLPASLDQDEALYEVESYVVPDRVVRYRPADKSSTPVFAARPPFDETLYETRQVFYTSKDGTKVPLFLTGKKGLPRDGTTPVLLYGYGGFAVSETPYFSASLVPWLERGGLFAVANLRGGGEYGEEWHQAGMKGKKQNVFDDFIAAAEYLVAQKITSPERLAINGGSNGGLLVGAVLVQRPDLFGAAIPEVGVMDMLRYHKFTIGHAWAGEYGASDDPAAFRWLHRYSPLHNVKMGAKYPATLLLTGDHDDRVVPAHSYKLTAALQTAQAGNAPILIRVQTRTGHGAGKPLALQLDELADTYAFLVRTFGM